MVKETLFNRVARRARYESMLLSKQAWQALRHIQNGSIAKQVIFVAGVQRSGTNMMMDVLERSYKTDVFHEYDPRAFDNYQMRSLPVLRALVRASNATHVVFKALCELQDLRLFLNEFITAKATWIVRNFDDVVNSHEVLWKDTPTHIAAIVKDRNSAGWRGRGMSNSTHELVKKLYHPGLNNPSACALLWYFRNILFFEQGLDRDERVLLIRYETMVTEPNRQFFRLFKFLGLEYSTRVSRQVFANSIRKSRPLEIDPPIREVCAALAARFEALFSDHAEEK